jgi:gliding-associated putative ABC transporter substrate-binding component GldG
MFSFNRKTKLKAGLYSNTILIVGILVAINLLAGFFFYRADLTKNKNYSLSGSTKNILRSLDDLVTIKVYFSRDLPPNLVSLRQEVADLLAEYKTYGGDKLKIEFIDPLKDQATEREVLGLGIPKLQFNIWQKEKLQMVNGYSGIALFYADKKEIIPEVVGSQNLEYDLTTLIKKLTSAKQEKVAFATGNDELKIDQDLSLANQFLSQQYEVTLVDLNQNQSPPADVKTLLVVGPTKTFSEKEKYILDQFLMKGGSLLLAYNGVSVDQNLQTTKNNLELTDQFESYGLKLNSDLVLDGASFEIATFNTEYGPILTQYPFWPRIIQSGFNQDSVVVNKLQAVIFPWTSSIEIIKDKVKDNQIQQLAKTTDKSWQMTENFNLNPQQDFKPTEQKSYLIAATVFGKFTSFFAGKAAPEGFTDKPIENTNDSRLAVVGNAQFVRDGFVRQYQDNLIFFLNLVDNLTLSSDLISIRAKAISSSPLKNMSDSQRVFYKFAGILSPTLIVIILGIIKYIMRKRKIFEPEV